MQNTCAAFMYGARAEFSKYLELYLKNGRSDMRQKLIFCVLHSAGVHVQCSYHEMYTCDMYTLLR